MALESADLDITEMESVLGTAPGNATSIRTGAGSMEGAESAVAGASWAGADGLAAGLTGVDVDGSAGAKAGPGTVGLIGSKIGRAHV